MKLLNMLLILIFCSTLNASSVSSPGGVSTPFTGDSGSGGAAGLVPAPPADSAEEYQFLQADGTWSRAVVNVFDEEPDGFRVPIVSGTFGNELFTSSITINSRVLQCDGTSGAGGGTFTIQTQNVSDRNTDRILIRTGEASGHTARGIDLLGGNGNITQDITATTGNAAAGISGGFIFTTGTASTTRGSATFDVLNFELIASKFKVPTTTTTGGTTGAQTINKISGTVNFAAVASAITVTDSLVSATSLIFAVARTNDSTCSVKNVVPGAGSFVINMTATCTAETSVGFLVVN